VLLQVLNAAGVVATTMPAFWPLMGVKKWLLQPGYRRREAGLPA